MGYIGRLHAASFSAATCSTSAKEILHILAPSSGSVIIHEIVVTNRTTVSAMAGYAIARAGTTGVVGTTMANWRLDDAYSTFGGSIYGIAGSTNATGLSYLYRENVNVLNGWHYLPTPETRPKIAPGARLVVRREYSTTDDAIELTVVFEEE